MADSTNQIREYSRTVWKLSDLRDLVEDTDAWSGDSIVVLTAAQPRTPAGTIEVMTSG